MILNPTLSSNGKFKPESLILMETVVDGNDQILMVSLPIKSTIMRNISQSLINNSLLNIAVDFSHLLQKKNKKVDGLRYEATGNNIL